MSVDADAQEGHGDCTQGTPEEGAVWGRVRDSIGRACATWRGGGARLQGLGTGVGTCGLQTTCEEGLAFRGSWREGSRLGTCTAIHIYQVGRLDDLQPNVVCK